MITGRFYHAICNFKDCIYVFGGVRMISAEKFDFGPKWNGIASLKSNRETFSCIIHKGHIYIEGHGSTNIDIYNPETNQYEVMYSLLPTPTARSIMMTVGGKVYMLRKKDFLRIDCDQ